MHSKLKLFVSFFIITGLIVGTVLSQGAKAVVPGTNTLVSTNNTGDGQGGNGDSPHDINGRNQAISSDSRYVVFTSSANNLVAGDTNGKPDVFVRDLTSNVTTRVNVSTLGIQADGGISTTNGDKVAISATGRYVVFPSLATNLIDGQTISTPQVYMRDTVANTTTVVSQTNSGVLADKAGGATVDGVSDDGRFVVWVANLNNLVSTETNNKSYYVYFTDLKHHTTEVLNHTSATDGHFVRGATMSCDGSLIAFSTDLQLDPSDTNTVNDIYIADMRHGFELTAVSLGVGSSTLPTLSCNGEYLVFGSGYKYLYDRVEGSTARIDTSTSGTGANNSSDGYGGVDDKGNVVFSSTATNLWDGHTVSANQIYLKHRDTGVTELLSRASGGGAWSTSNSYMTTVSLSADGKTAVYAPLASTSTNLLSSDTNGFRDVIASATGL